MILDFTFEQVMRLSNLKRWGIVEMFREQSVAEHSYNVAMISAYIVDQLPNEVKSTHLREAVVNWSLVHDLPELITGDIPTPIKELIKTSLDGAEEDLFPQLMNYKKSHSKLAMAVCKAADLMDAIQYARKFCVDSRKVEIISEMVLFLGELADNMLGGDEATELEKVIRRICEDEKIL